MFTLLLAALCQTAPLDPPPGLLNLLETRRMRVDSNEAARVAAEAVVRLADPKARFFDAAGAAAFEAALNGSATNPPVLRELGEGLILLKPAVLNGAVADLVATGLVRASVGGGGFILDCRGTEGADLACVDAIAGHFAGPDVFLYAVQDAAGEDLELHAAPPAAPASVPVLVLTDAATSGTAELLAALFTHPRGVMLVGARTPGDAARRQMTSLPDGRFAFLATGWFTRPDGTTWQGRGVTPHVEAPAGAPARPPVDTNVTSRTGKPLDATARRHLELFARVRDDAVLARAVDLLLGFKALAILPETPHDPVRADENR